MRVRRFWVILTILGLGMFVACSNPSGSSSDADESTTEPGGTTTDTGGDPADTGAPPVVSTPTFTGTWVHTVSATETFTYVYKEDKTFTYTWIKPGMTVVYMGTFTYDEATLKYKETVQQQIYDGGTPVQGGWDTNYSYTLSATTLTFSDGANYNPSFTKQ